MKRSLATFLAVCILGFACLAYALEPDQFEYSAEIAGRFVPDRPARMHLNADLISKCGVNLKDLRIYDDLGRETPYVVYTHEFPAVSPSRVEFKVVSYEQKEAVTEILIKAALDENEPVPPFNLLEFHTGLRDFHKRVILVEPSSNAVIADDAIYDFSSKVDLRKTSISFPIRDNRSLLVRIKDEKSLDNVEDETIRLTFKDMEFTKSGAEKQTVFRVNRFIAASTEGLEQSVEVDQRILTATKIGENDQGDTIIDLGPIFLPVRDVTLDLDKAYYNRRVEVWIASEEGSDEFSNSRRRRWRREMEKRIEPGGEGRAYSRVTSDTIYRHPDLDALKNVVHVGLSHAEYLRLKIINQDNPPLPVSKVGVEWVRRYLYFIPEAGRTYTAYAGSQIADPPKYEVVELIKKERSRLLSYPVLHLNDVKKNSAFEAEVESGSRAWYERGAFYIAVIAAVLIMAVWLFSLIRKLPAASDK